jgi:wobble nucleotide-excising tRNase
MLKKIISIKNVGRFRNSALSGNPQLAKHTYVVGANGFGKTTLCAVLRSLKTGDASHILGRKSLGVTDDPTVEFLFDTGNIRFDGAQWSAPRPAITIFDGVFVAENVHSGDVVDIEQKRNLYRVIIGDHGVKLAEQEADLAQRSRSKTTEITTAARAVQAHVPAGMKMDAFAALPSAENVDTLISEQEKRVETARQASVIKDRKALSEFSLPDLPARFEQVLGTTIDDVAADAEAKLTTHIAEHGMADGGGNWIAEGLEHARDTCPFCGQEIAGLELIAAFRSVFSKCYEALATEISTMSTLVSQLFGDAALARLETLAEQNKSSAEFWAKYVDVDASSLELPAEILAAAASVREMALEFLVKKAGTPLEAILIDARFTTAVASYDIAKAAVTAANRVIQTTNSAIAAKKVATAVADIKAEEAELARLKACKVRHMPVVATLCDAHGALVTAKDFIDKQKDAARAALDAHTSTVVKPYQNRINSYLTDFNAGFSITETKHGYPGGVATSSYQLLINGTAVDVGDGKTPVDQPSFKNTLSAGDRTTLALAVFLAHLERDPTAKDTIVVFDDPFNSQDSFRRRQTVHEIMKVADKCLQIVVLSHDATFLKQLWDKAPSSERVCVGISDHRSLGSKISEISLDRATQGRTATDIDDLQTYVTNGAGALIDVVRKMRVVLETYCRTTYPTSFQPNEWLGEMVGRIRAGGDSHPAAALYSELDQINDYTSQYHHGEDMEDVTPDQIDPNELTGYARRTLRIVNALQA